MMLPSQHPRYLSHNFALGFLANAFRVVGSALGGGLRGAGAAFGGKLHARQTGAGAFLNRLGNTTQKWFNKNANYVKYGAIAKKGDKVAQVVNGVKYVGSQGAFKTAGRTALAGMQMTFEPYIALSNRLPSMALKKMGFNKAARFWGHSPIAKGVGTVGTSMAVPAIASRVATRNDGPKTPPTYYQNVQYSYINKGDLIMKRFKNSISFSKRDKNTALGALAASNSSALGDLAKAEIKRKMLRHNREANSMNSQYRDK